MRSVWNVPPDSEMDAAMKIIRFQLKAKNLSTFIEHRNKQVPTVRCLSNTQRTCLCSLNQFFSISVVTSSRRARFRDGDSPSSPESWTMNELASIESSPSFGQASCQKTDQHYTVAVINKRHLAPCLFLNYYFFYVLTWTCKCLAKCQRGKILRVSVVVSV